MTGSPEEATFPAYAEQEGVVNSLPFSEEFEDGKLSGVPIDDTDIKLPPNVDPYTAFKYHGSAKIFCKWVGPEFPENAAELQGIYQMVDDGSARIVKEHTTYDANQASYNVLLVYMMQNMSLDPKYSFLKDGAPVVYTKTEDPNCGAVSILKENK